MIESVRGILDAVFEDYRNFIGNEFAKLGYEPGWKLMKASDFGVPQLRPRVVFVGIRKDISEHFSWPMPFDFPPKTVGETLYVTSLRRTDGRAQMPGAKKRTKLPRR